MKGKDGAGIMQLLATGLHKRNKLTARVIREALGLKPKEERMIVYEDLKTVAEFVLKQMKK